MVVRVEVLRRGGVGHACRHRGRLGQNPGSVDGLGKLGRVGRGSGGGWHVELVVGVAVAQCHQLLLATVILTVQRLAAHDQLTFGRDPRGDGNRLRCGEPQRLQVHAVDRDERDVAGQPYRHRTGVRRAGGQRDALN